MLHDLSSIEKVQPLLYLIGGFVRLVEGEPDSRVIITMQRTPAGGDPTYEYISRDQLAAEMMMIILEKFLDDEIDKETFLTLKRKLEEDIGN